MATKTAVLAVFVIHEKPCRAAKARFITTTGLDMDVLLAPQGGNCFLCGQPLAAADAKAVGVAGPD